MNKELALQILKEALNIAIAKGCFGLTETSNIIQALATVESLQEIEFGEIEEIKK